MKPRKCRTARVILETLEDRCLPYIFGATVVVTVAAVSFSNLTSLAEDDGFAEPKTLG